jgi:hypothetical protein
MEQGGYLGKLAGQHQSHLKAFLSGDQALLGAALPQAYPLAKHYCQTILMVWLGWSVCLYNQVPRLPLCLPLVACSCVPVSVSLSRLSLLVLQLARAPAALSLLLAIRCCNKATARPLGRLGKRKLGGGGGSAITAPGRL